MATKKKPSEPKYKLSIKLGDTVLKSEGATALEAMKSMKRPQKITTKGALTLSYGKLATRELLYTPVRLKRVFYPNAQFFIAKQLVSLLK